MGGKELHGWFRKIGARLFKKSLQPETVLDTIDLKLWGLSIHITRELPANIPYELTVVIPRTELRKNCALPLAQRCGLDINLNSITIAHSPRFEHSEPKPNRVPPSSQPQVEQKRIK